MWGIVICLWLYIIFLVPAICKRKIYNHIEILDGQVCDIERLSMRDRIYVVHYIKSGEQLKAVVKFRFLFDERWD